MSAVASFTVPSTDYARDSTKGLQQQQGLQTSADESPMDSWSVRPARERGIVCGMQLDHFVWMMLFCATGVGLGMTFEYMELHSPKHAPASGDSFFLCLIGYWSQSVLGVRTSGLNRPKST